MVKKYCHILPNFPKKAFVVIPLIIRDLLSIDFFPLYATVETIEGAVNYVEEFASEIRKKDNSNSIEVMDSCVIIPLTFNTLYPLRKEFWNNPHINYSSVEREKLFLKFIRNPAVHLLLVNPSLYDAKAKKWTLEPTLPLKLGVSSKAIENFMLSSDAVVDERASHAAIYSAGEGMRLNRKTKKIELLTFENFKSEVKN